MTEKEALFPQDLKHGEWAWRCRELPFIQSFFHSFFQYLLSIYSVPGINTCLGSVDKQDRWYGPYFCGAYILVEEKDKYKK